MDRFQQESQLDEATRQETAAALIKSRQFLTQRLLPDLENVNSQHESIVTQIDDYKALRDTLRSLDSNVLSSAQDADMTRLTDVGAGIAVQTQM